MSTHRKAIGAAAIAAVLVTAGCASAGAGGAATGPASAQMIATGQGLYSTSCAGCHGQAGVGTPRGPNLADDQWIWIQSQQAVRPQIVGIIRNGIPTPRVHMSGMPALGANMTEEQMQSIAAYVESL